MSCETSSSTVKTGFSTGSDPVGTNKPDKWYFSHVQPTAIGHHKRCKQEEFPGAYITLRDVYVLAPVDIPH